MAAKLGIISEKASRQILSVRTGEGCRWPYTKKRILKYLKSGIFLPQKYLISGIAAAFFCPDLCTQIF
jgi:hypothetical protein